MVQWNCQKPLILGGVDGLLQQLTGDVGKVGAPTIAALAHRARGRQ